MMDNIIDEEYLAWNWSSRSLSEFSSTLRVPTTLDDGNSSWITTQALAAISTDMPLTDATSTISKGPTETSANFPLYQIRSLLFTEYSLCTRSPTETQEFCHPIGYTFDDILAVLTLFSDLAQSSQ
ncbi:hypothetical protein Tco_0514960 [Tanacetum coccineum]